jgi:uncharacterized protein DUF6152
LIPAYRVVPEIEAFQTEDRRRPVKGLKVLTPAIGVLIASIPLFAHHGNAAYDSKNTVSVKGTVTEWYWANPHCLLQFDVKDDKDQLVHWAAETSNPADMVNRGWTKLSLKPGDQISVTLEPAKNGKPIGRVLEIVLPTGQKLSGGFGAPGALKSDDAPKK